MSVTLKLTNHEVDQLINRKLEERFEEIFNDIPFYHPDYEPERGETHRNFCEDDGREFRWLIVKDIVTGIEYSLNYTYNTEWPNDIMSLPDNIQIVSTHEESSLNVEIVPEVKEEPVEVLSLEAQADKVLMDAYKAIEGECRLVEKKEKLKIPKEEIQPVFDLLKSNAPFSIYDLRKVIVPVAIKYKLEEKSFWTWIQVKRGVWK